LLVVQKLIYFCVQKPAKCTATFRWWFTALKAVATFFFFQIIFIRWTTIFILINTWYQLLHFSAHTPFLFTNWTCLENLQCCYLTFNNTQFGHVIIFIILKSVFVYLSWFSSFLDKSVWWCEENCDGLRCLKVYKSCLCV